MSTDAVVPAQAIPEGMKAVTKYTAEHAREVGLPSPEAINYMMSIAGMLCSTALITKDMGLPPEQIGQLKAMGFAPADIEAKIEKAIRSNAMAKMLVGRELRMEAMEALMDIDIVKGRIFVRYPQLIRQIELKGCKIKTIERSHKRAAIEVTRPESEPEIFEFTIEDAKLAGLTDSYRSGEKSQYEKRPRVMLWARVISEAYRATGGRGNVYTPEERSEVVGDDDDHRNGSDREFAQAAADRVAEEDPALRLVRKATAATLAGAVGTSRETTVEATATLAEVPKAEEPAEPAKVREPRKPKPSAPAEPVKAPLPEQESVTAAASTEKQEAFSSQMALNARAGKMLEKIPGSDLLGMGKVYYGYFGSDPGGMPKTWEPYHHVLDLLEPWLEVEGVATKFLKDPEKMGKTLRTMEQDDQKAKATTNQVEKQAVADAPGVAIKMAEENPLAKEFGWGPETVKAATALMSKYKFPVDKMRVSLKTFGLLDVPEDHVRAMFVLWYHSPDAQMVKRRGAEKGLDILQCAAKIAERVGSPITLETDSAKVQTAVLSTLTEIQSL